MMHDHTTEAELPDIDPDVMAEEAEQQERRLLALRGETTPKGIDDAIAAGYDPRPLTDTEEAEQLRLLRQVAGETGRVRCVVSKDYDITRRNLEAALAEVGGELLFEKDGVLLTPGDHDLYAFSPASIKGTVARYLEFGYYRRDKDGEERWVPQGPPTDVLEYLRDRPRDFPSVVKPLRRHVTAPVMLADGTVTTEPGYYPESKLYYSAKLRCGRLDLPLEEAISIIEAPLSEFPFVDRSDLANLLAYVFTLATDEPLRGRPPIAAIIAPKEGTGKGLLASVPTLLTTGKLQTTISYSRDQESFNKELFSTMLTAPQVINIDNVDGVLDSPKLCSIMTEEATTTRRLGQTLSLTVENSSIWLVTGNNLELTGELIRRAVLVRLDARCEDPEERTFTIKDLAAWIRQPDNQTRYVSAVLAILRHWLDAGAPRFRQRKLGSFVQWSEVIGGILEFIGHGGFLENKDHFRSSADPERETWRAFLSEWWKQHRHAEVTAGDLCEVINYHDPGTNYRIRQEPLLPIGGSPSSNPAIKLGYLLKKKLGQVYRVPGVGELQIVKVDRRTAHKMYCLQPVVSGTNEILGREGARA